MIQLSQINEFQQEEAFDRFFQCCASPRWAQGMVEARPFEDASHLLSKAETLWNSLQEVDWLEAFKGHPQIGDMSSLRKKYAKTTGWSSQEQSGVNGSSEENLRELSEYNRKYQEKYGFIFIICATGKSASQMLEILKGRMNHSRSEEISIAAQEQSKITAIRLEKMQ